MRSNYDAFLLLGQLNRIMLNKTKLDAAVKNG